MKLFSHELVYPGYLFWGDHITKSFTEVIENFDESKLMVYGGPDKDLPNDNELCTAVAWMFYPITDNYGVLILPLADGAAPINMKAAYRAKPPISNSDIKYLEDARTNILATAKENGWDSKTTEAAINALPKPRIEYTEFIFPDGERLLNDISNKVRAEYPSMSLVSVKLITDRHNVTSREFVSMSPEDVVSIMVDALSDAINFAPSRALPLQKHISYLWD